MRCAVLLPVFAALTASPLAARPVAQDLERVPTPIEVFVSGPSAAAALPTPATPAPLVVPTGTRVRIHGTSIPFGDAPAARQVTVAVKPPAGPETALAAAVGADMKWSTTFAGTSAAGTYVVTATAPDSRRTATTTFTVGTAADIAGAAESLVRTIEKVAVDASAAIDAVRTSLDAKGPYPNQAAVNEQLAWVNAQLRQHPARLTTVRRAFGVVGQVAQQYPGGASELEPFTTAAAETAQQVESAGERIRTTTSSVRRDSGMCDAIDAVIEVLGSMSLYFDLQGQLYTKMIQLAGDKFLPDRIYTAAVPLPNRDNTQRYALSESIKSIGTMISETIDGAISVPAPISRGIAVPSPRTLPLPERFPARESGLGRGLIKFVREPQNLLLDTAQYLGGLVFDQFCEKFTGPFTGTFSVDATVGTGAKFWGYTMTFGGTLTVRYEKARPRAGEAVAVTGEFEGNGSFRMYEDLMALNPFNRRFILFRYLFPPIGFPGTLQDLVNPLGKVARMLTPAYFRVPVTGTVTADQLTLKVGAQALQDFTDLVRGNALYVAMPPASPAPYVMIAKIPVQKAQFVISRAVRNEVTLPIATTGEGRAMIKSVSKAFDRRETVSNGEITVLWHLDLRACNPECAGR